MTVSAYPIMGGNVSKRTGEARMCPGQCVKQNATSSGVVVSLKSHSTTSAIKTNTRNQFFGLIIPDQVIDEDNPGFYANNKNIQLAVQPGRIVDVLAMCGERAAGTIQAGDALIVSAPFSGLGFGAVQAVTTRTVISTAVASGMTIRDVALLKAIDDLAVTAYRWGTTATVSAATKTATFTASSVSAATPPRGAFVVCGSAGAYQINRIEKVEGNKITLALEMDASMSTSYSFVQLKPLRSVIL